MVPFGHYTATERVRIGRAFREKNLGTQLSVVCLMSRREFDETGELCSREYRSSVEFHLPPRDRSAEGVPGWL